MKECSKSIIRRQSDPNFLNRYFIGDGIDIGGAPDPLSLYRELFPRMGEVRIWDLDDGDAQRMEGVDDERYDFVHSSHCLEHLRDPDEGLANWFRLLKPGGHLIVTVPDEDLYEQGVFPSTFNSDHKWTLTIFKQDSWSAHSRNVLDMIGRLGPAADVQKIELLTASYRYDLPRFDQTLTPIAEAGIEFVVRKRTKEEMAFGGRRPRAGAVTDQDFTLLTGIRLQRQKASVNQGQSEDIKALLDAAIAEHQAGELAAAEEKYRAILDSHGDQPDALHLLGVCLYQDGRYAESKRLIEKAIALKPSVPEFHNSLGALLRALRQHDGACKALARALRLSPDYLEAHNNLGLTLTDMKQYENAETVLRMALTHEPDDPEVRTGLGRVFLFQDKLDSAVSEFENVLRVEPEHAAALNNLGVALNLLGDGDSARAAFERALAADPEHVDAHYNLGNQLLAKGDFETGWTHYDWRLRRPDFRRKFMVPRWQGEALEGRTILIWCEQGMGDAINFIRYAPMVAARGGRVVVECRPPLQRLFAGVEGVSAVADIREADGYDLHVPLLSLPKVFETRLESIPATVPYLPVPDPAVMQTDTASCKVGLVWAGNPDYSRDASRSRPLTDFAPLAAVSGVSFFSLQYGAGPTLAQVPALGMTDLVADVQDFYDTASRIAGLDLIISVDTAVGHLAGAIGIPVWMLIDKASDWRWLLDRDDTPWYPTMRLIRRQTDWSDLFVRLTKELAAFAAR